jgi:hypothetical protein
MGTADAHNMSITAWQEFLTQLVAADAEKPMLLFGEYRRFRAFVDDILPSQRIPLLLHAYDQYRAAPWPNPDRKDWFIASCHSILISTILTTHLAPTEEEALAILHKSFHRCGHGDDVAPPLNLAEQVFDRRPYTLGLFDAAAAYLQSLRGTKSIISHEVKRRLSWILWHDPRRIEKRCWTGRIQRDLHAIKPEQAWGWQWLLRHPHGGKRSVTGKAWRKEGERRLALVGVDSFLTALDRWFQIPAEPIVLKPAGSVMLQRLIVHAGLIEPAQSRPILLRLRQARWAQRAVAEKVIAEVGFQCDPEQHDRSHDAQPALA